MVKTLGFLLAAVVAVSTSAGDIRGTVGEIWASPSTHHVMFTINGNDADPARCNSSKRYSISLRQPGGRATFETLLLAAENEYAIWVQGLKTCNGYDAENIKFLVLE